MTTTTDSAPTPEEPTSTRLNPLSDDYFRDTSRHVLDAARGHPVFYHPPLGVWVVAEWGIAEKVLTDWKRFSNEGNGSTIPVPEQHQEQFPSELLSKILIGMDPPEHAQARNVAQMGFSHARMEALRPAITERAHRIIDRFQDHGSGELMEEYCLELTTQTLLAHMGLGAEHDAMMRQLRDDWFLILGSGVNPLEEPTRSEVWERFASAQQTLRGIIRERRENPGQDLISDMAVAEARDGSKALSVERIAIHLAEFAAAGTDTTAQAMANALIFLDQNPQVRAEAQNNPELWERVFEETVRRRPSATFASRRAVQDIDLGGAQIKTGDTLWIALAGANADSNHTEDPFNFDIHRPDPRDHLGFTRGRHTCLGQALARVQGTTGLQVLHERLPSIRPVEGFPLDFVPIPLLPIRRTLPVQWNTPDSEQ